MKTQSIGAKFRHFSQQLLVTFTLTSAAFGVEIGTFSVDVTPPVGHQLLTGGGIDSTGVEDPLYAKGFVLTDAEFKPVVFVSVDWAEIRGKAFDRWRDLLASTAETTRERVFVTSIHQHDTPLADLEAQRILEKAGAEAQVIDLEFHEATVQRVAKALVEALKSAEPVTHIGTGQAEVIDVASNRRYVKPDGGFSYGRYSGGGDLVGRTADVGVIDPMLKTISFWNGEKAVCALSIYATHPMSYYRTGRMSADFPGMARQKRQDETPDTLQIYASGASGNVTVGKFNNGKREMRAVFAERLHNGMNAAWEATEKHEIGKLGFKNETLTLAPRTSAGYSRDELTKKLAEATTRSKQSSAALGLSWLNRSETGQPIDVPMVDFGVAQLILLPAEIYVEYQIFAQSLRPDSFVMTAGYGECGPGYIPVEQAWEEKDGNLGGWCWVDPGAEAPIKKVLQQLLEK
ncbi:MAG: hypothetical protein ACI8UO_004434 [Verrucomicrobiales bacterium]|jgi:hypothetical protein